MCVFASHATARHVENEEIPLRHERDRACKLPDGEISPQVFDVTESVKCHARDACRVYAFVTRYETPTIAGGRPNRITPSNRIDVPRDPRRITDHDCIR